MSKENKPLEIEADDEKQEVKIEGTRFTYEFFRAFKEGNSDFPLNKLFMLVNRKDGVITVKKVCENSAHD